MVNPYHDGNGKFTSKAKQEAKVDSAAKQNDASAYFDGREILDNAKKMSPEKKRLQEANNNMKTAFGKMAFRRAEKEREEALQAYLATDEGKQSKQPSIENVNPVDVKVERQRIEQNYANLVAQGKQRFEEEKKLKDASEPEYNKIVEKITKIEKFVQKTSNEAAIKRAQGELKTLLERKESADKIRAEQK